MAAAVGQRHSLSALAMHPELAAQHAALEALADPITPLPAVAPVKTRTGTAWRPQLGAVDFLCGLVLTTRGRDRARHRPGRRALQLLGFRSASARRPRKDG